MNQGRFNPLHINCPCESEDKGNIEYFVNQFPVDMDRLRRTPARVLGGEIDILLLVYDNLTLSIKHSQSYNEEIDCYQNI